MNGDRKLFTCPKCSRKFWYWVLADAAQPKVKCSFCATESYPNGEPPKPPASAPAPTPAATPTPTPTPTPTAS